MSTASAATVAPVLASNATAALPDANRSAMIPEPITAAASSNDPRPSAASRCRRFTAVDPAQASGRWHPDAAGASGGRSRQWEDS